MKKLSLTDRVRVAVTGQTKGFIPSLAAIDAWGDTPLSRYTTGPEQLRANIGMVYAANTAIVEPTAAVQLKLGKRGADGEIEEILEHPLLDLLENPSKAHDGETMRELHHTYRNLVGESYFLMVKGGRPFEMKLGQLPDALQVLPAHLVEFKLGKSRYSDSTIKYGQTEYKLSEIIRDFVPDPGNPYVGRSIVSAAAAAIDTDESMQNWNRRMFKNNGRPGLVFNLQGDNIDSSVYDNLKQQMQELYSGGNTFKSLVVENGEVKPYMLNAQDLDFLASREFTQGEILGMFKVASAMIGMTKEFNRANMDGARYAHYLINVVPRLRKEVRMWNNALVKPYDPTLELYFDNPVPEDVEAKLKEATEGVNSWLTIDEVRAERGLDELPGGLGAQLYVPINTVPLSDISAPIKPAPAKPVEPAPADDLEDDGEDEANTEGKKGLPKPKGGPIKNKGWIIV